MSIRFFALLVGAFLAVVGACSPAQQKAVEAEIPALTHEACVILHDVAQDGKADTVCATADDLAPLVPTILAARTESSDAGPGVARAAMARVTVPIAELPTPTKRAARRRCVAWMLLEKGQAIDAGP